MAIIATRRLKRAIAIRLRGRDFQPAEIHIIRELTNRHFAEGRTAISVAICNQLDWRQPNGWLKDRACRDVLVKLESLRLVRLPASKIRRRTHKLKLKSEQLVLDLDETPLTEVDFRTLRIVLVKGTKDERLWNQLVRKYHYLGFTVFVGRSLKYVVYAGDRVIAALGICDPAWSVAARDTLLTQAGINADSIRSRCVNNGRFLIMPWVRVSNLASFLLAAAIPRFVRDWREYYSIDPILFETFVDPTRFLGTCYKAANWLYIGDTCGYRKLGSAHKNSQTPKMIFLYPVNRKLRMSILHATPKNDAIPNHRTNR